MVAPVVAMLAYSVGPSPVYTRVLAEFPMLLLYLPLWSPGETGVIVE